MSDRRVAQAVRILGVLLLAALAAVVRQPAAHAAGSTLKPTQEAWYQPDPTCVLPTGCLLPLLSKLPFSVTPPDPYPTGTLHVAVATGKESARAYLAFNYGALGPLTSAQLDIPLDTSATDGSIAPSSAKIEACLATAPFASTEASYALPPAVDCGRRAELKYVAKPQPHLTADLAPIMAGLETTSGIALLPDTKHLAQTDLWQVAFSTHDRKSKGTGPATLSVTPAAESASPNPVVSSLAPTSPSAGVEPAVVPPTVTLPGQVTTVEPPAGVAPTIAGTPVLAAEVSGDSSFQYPLLFLFPLLLLLAVPIAARALTQDLDQSDHLEESDT